MSAASRPWERSVFRGCTRGKLIIYPNTAHSSCGAPFAIRFAAWGYGLAVSKRAVRRKIARNRNTSQNLKLIGERS